MDEEQVKIKKVITTVDDDKSYSIDVDETTTFYEFKKILASAAHLLKNCFRIFHGQQEYTSDYDDNTIVEIFQDLNPIPLRIVSIKDVYEFEDELISVRFNINVPCNEHIGKYKMLYCFSCNKSICMDCFGQNHKNHKVEEKADYLAPAQLLMNRIFANSSIYKADSRLSKYMECVNFRSNLKLNIFDNLRKLINDLEIKFASCLEFFSTSEDETEKNTNENLQLLKKYCVECFIKLKNDINTKGIIIDDEIFLTLYHKLKEIERYKSEYFEENKQKYERLNTLLAPFVQQIEKISDELKITFANYLNQGFYETFRKSIEDNMVDKIQKEQVNDIMFRNLGVPRKSLNRMSMGVVTAYKKTGRNTYISPDKIQNQVKEKNPFQRAIYSPQQQGMASESLLGYNASSQAGKQNYSSYTYSKNEDQKKIGTALSMISENVNEKVEDSHIYGDNSQNHGYETKKVISTTTTTNTNNINNLNINNNVGVDKGIVGRRVEETIKTNVTTSNLTNLNTNVQGMKSILNNNIGTTNMNINSNIATNNMNLNSNIGASNMNINMNMNSLAESNLSNINSNINKTINNVKTVTNVSNVSGIGNYGGIGGTQNIKKETTVYTTNQTSYPTTTTNFIQKEYNAQNLGPSQNINESQAQKNITKTTTTTTTITTNNLNNIAAQNRGINTNLNTNMNAIGMIGTNITNNVDKSLSSQGYQVTKYTTTTTTNQNQIHHGGAQQVSSTSNAMFGGKLVDVLNNEISKNEMEYQEKMKNQNIIQETHTQHLLGNNGTYIQRVVKTETVEYGNPLAPMFLFMYPIFNTNKIVGAVEDESTGKVVVDFSQAFGKDDIQLTEFPQGGAFCNLGKFLYFAGGQETQKGIGKLFLRVSISKNDFKANLVKMPEMKNSHWNHTMIANDNYVFVIGGNNSNKCECFNLKTSKWESMPNLNSEERQRPILEIYKDNLYAFMGYTQYSILDSVERININKLGSSSIKWEKLSISNPDSINLKFFGAGVYNNNGKLYFIGGKVGKGLEEEDYKAEICRYDFDNVRFVSTEICYNGYLNFIENRFHRCNEDTIGNFIELNDGCLATIGVSALLKSEEESKNKN